MMRRACVVDVQLGVELAKAPGEPLSSWQQEDAVAAADAASGVSAARRAIVRSAVVPSEGSGDESSEGDE
jgi:hypothetical protein